MSAFAPSIAVLLPCYNEAATIRQVIADFRHALPEARIIVLDNNSKDDTAELARSVGAEVYSVALQGKGNVVRRAFADIEADVYLMADGDSTYDASRARELITPIITGKADTVIGVREGEASSFPTGHIIGNKLFNLIIGRLFGRGLQDIFSGYRAFSRRFAKSFPSHSEGFEIETEMSIFILEQRIPAIEILTKYGVRPEGSHSKLRTYRDGARILITILRMFKESRPMAFFSYLALVILALAILLALPLIAQYEQTGLVPRQPTAILCTGLALLSGLTFFVGLMLDSVARAYRETRHLRYLNVAPRQR